MSYLADTNLLLRSVQDTYSMHPIAVAAIEAILNSGEHVHILPQSIIEFWAVATRPIANNGLDLSIDETILEVEKIKSFLTLLPDTEAIFTEWEQLVTDYKVSGKNVHDAHLAAGMLAHSITHLLTFNGADFKRFPITIVDPAKI